ncbi:MAG: Sensor histidine kinase TodS [Bacteroidetes bacterium ADurb.Bin174]|nr:MAG: Sensor histidine kinase TodS [Bacteroidetes bacterium ADurb.Bin174]
MVIVKKIVLFTLLFFSVSVGAFQQQDYYFRHLTTEDGLSQNTVLSILQDDKGFMWFGTKDGLNRYDGKSVKVFKYEKDNDYCLGNNTIWSLLQLPDGKIWIGTDKGIYVYDPIYEHFTPFLSKTKKNESITNEVLDMQLDKFGNIWISSQNLFRYSLNTNELETFLYTEREFSDESSFLAQTWSVNIDYDDQVWINIMHGGIKRFNPYKNELINYYYDSHGNDLLSSQISRSIDVSKNFLLIGSFNDGLRLLDKTNGEITSFRLNSNISQNLFVRTLGVFSDENYWIGTESGLYIYDPVQKEMMVHLTHNINDPCSLSDNAIYSMYEDREGGVWIGTYFGGVNYYPLPYNYFKRYYPVANKNSISGERVSGICEDADGNIWIGTEDAGLNKLDVESNLFESFLPNHPPSGLSYHNVHDVVLDDELLWIATFSQGINVYNTKTKKWKYYVKGNQEGMLKNNDIFAIFKDSSSNIWIGTSNGTYIFDRKTDKFIPQEYMGQHFVSDIIEDSYGNIWFSTYDQGAFCYNLRTQECVHYNYDSDVSGSICHYKLTCMFIDSQKRIWFASESRGICRFDYSTQNFITYELKDGLGLSNITVYKILEDDNKNLWLSSNLGIVKFNPQNTNIQFFTQDNGVFGKQFNYKSGHKDKSGRMYFGSVRGLVSFHPSNLQINENVPAVSITEFSLLSGQTITRTNNDHLTLKYNQSAFKISFAALSYVAPEMNRYACMMEGLETDWNYLGHSNEITYSNLRPGKYTFKVKASNNDGFWNDEGESLIIQVSPPFWRTNVAWVLYTILVFFSIFKFISYYKNKSIKESKRNQIIFEKEKEKEIYNSKIQFFTQIAHEVRTPLTLINGPLEYILNNDVKKDELHNNLRIMKNNTDRLLSLINQLLDFRKFESGRIDLTYTHQNLNEIIEEIYTRFKQLIKQKSLNFVLSLPSQPVFADVDKEAFIKIVSNLFSNAIKFGNKKVEVELSEGDEYAKLTINNDGKKIPKIHKDDIFCAFFQIGTNKEIVNSGSGIGLSIVKSFVELHGGNVYLDVQKHEMNSFVVKLPKKQSRVFEMHDDLTYVSMVETYTKEISHEKKQKSTSILLVEDDEELLVFLKDRLQSNYRILTAKNGVEALMILNKEIVHLVVSDIMMPVMDGIELCRKIKNESKYAHLPIILLTAKADIQSKIIGFESFADAYVEKPFSLEYLKLQISNLIENRNKIRETFINSPLVLHASTTELNKSNEQFLKKLTEEINNNLSNEHFNVDHLAKSVNMSRSSLLRKVKELFDSTPSDLIRSVRLKRAAEIFTAGNCKINEVCYHVGFTSPSYFAKAFQKEFGILPKDFVKEISISNSLEV